MCGDRGLNIMRGGWVKPAVTLILLSITAWLAPTDPVDPWNLFSPAKVAKMVLALAVIQVLGSGLSQYLGVRTGAVLSGFLGGLISSTATTASSAKRSKVGEGNSSGELLVFLSATGAMLLEGLLLVIMGTEKVHISQILIFFGPILATIGMIVVYYRRHEKRPDTFNSTRFQILPILKLSIFIVAILSVSKVLQNFFGENGLLVFTSLVSLFEIHGSVIANVQLHESGTVTVRFLCSLLTVSVVASCFSKLILISTLGSSTFRRQVVKSTGMLFVSLALSWAMAMSMS